MIQRGTTYRGEGRPWFEGWEGNAGKNKNYSRRLPGFEGHWSSSPPGTNLSPQRPLVDVLSVLSEFPILEPLKSGSLAFGGFLVFRGYFSLGHL